MEVKSGYRQTEVGVIPEDWGILRFRDHFHIYAGGDVPKDSLSQIQSEDHPYPIFANAIQNKGLYGFTSIKRGKPDSVTITARGYLGHAEYRDEPFFPIVRLLVLEPTGALDAKYTTYAINDRVEFSIESTGVPQLTAPQVGKYAVAAPPTLEEQHTIATALSDVDALMEGLDRLIAKKRDLKQAAMQQLLTGRTRLPGFKGEWRDTTLGAIIARFSTGLNPRHNFQLNAGGSLFYVTIKNFSEGHLRLDDQCDLIDERAFRLINQRADLRKDDILFSSIGRIGDAYLIAETPTNWNINESVFTLRPDIKQVEPAMLYHLLTNRSLKDALGQGATGSTFKSIKQADLKAIACKLPVSHDEQTAIAAVLSDMDAEIEAIEQRRAKTADLKQSMMQELLTGKTRLVTPEAIHA